MLLRLYIDIERFIKLSSNKHDNLRHGRQTNPLLIGKYKGKNTSINVSGSFRLCGNNWEKLINNSNLNVNKYKWLDFSVNVNKKSFLNNNLYEKIYYFDLEEAYLQQLFTNSYPDLNKNEKSVLKFYINNKKNCKYIY